jgi:hypothetical protein
LLAILGDGAKPVFAPRVGQEFTAGHATILMMNSVFGNCDRCDFRDSMTSLIRFVDSFRSSGVK